MMRIRSLSLCLGTLFIFTVCGAMAAAAPTADVQKIVDEVRSIAAKARKERSGDPSLLQALDDVVKRYYWPWRNTVADDAFKDGNYTKNPAWEVAGGSFVVDASLGLRSQATPAPAADASGKKKKKDNLGQVLKEAVIAEMQKGKEKPAAESQYIPAEIYLPAKIANTFATDIVFTQHQSSSQNGRIEFGFFEGTRRDRGYLLAFTSGAESTVELQRVKDSGSAIIEKATLPAPFATGEQQNLSWRRDPDGNMVVILNDKTLIQATDKGMTSTFKSFGVTNRAGDYAVRHVTIVDAP